MTRRAHRGTRTRQSLPCREVEALFFVSSLTHLSHTALDLILYINNPDWTLIADQAFDNRQHSTFFRPMNQPGALSALASSPAFFQLDLCVMRWIGSPAASSEHWRRCVSSHTRGSELACEDQVGWSGRKRQCGCIGRVSGRLGGRGSWAALQAREDQVGRLGRKTQCSTRHCKDPE